MKILTPNRLSNLLIFFLSINSFIALYSQNSNSLQKQEFEKLLTEKRKLNSSITINNRYKIQIFTGTNELAKKELITFRKENKNIDATIVFYTPTYKVLIGNFKTRIEAEKYLNLYKKKYPNSIIIKPIKS